MYTSEEHMKAIEQDSASHLPVETNVNPPTLSRLYALTAEYARISGILATLRIEQQRLGDITRNHKTTKAAQKARAMATDQLRAVHMEMTNWSIVRNRLFVGFQVEQYVFDNFVSLNTPIPYTWIVKFADCPSVSTTAREVQFWSTHKLQSDNRHALQQKPAYFYRLNPVQKEVWYTHQARLAGRDMLPDVWTLGIHADYSFRWLSWPDGLYHLKMADGYGVGFQSSADTPKEAYRRVLHAKRRYCAYNYNRRDKLGRLIL